MTVLVTGIRGSIGGRVAAELHARGHDVRGGTSSLDSVPEADFPVVRVDLNDPATIAPALTGVDRVFLYAAHSAVDRVVRELRAAGIEHTVLLSSASVEMVNAEAIADHHRKVEDAVRDGDLSWTFLRPGAFAGNSLQWARQIRESDAVSLPFPDAQVEPIHEDDIVDAAVSVLVEPDRHRGKAYYLTGADSLTQRQQIDVIGAAIGRAIKVDELTPDQWRERVADFLPAHVADSLLAMWQSARGNPGPTDRTVRDVTGAEPRTFAHWAADNSAAFG